MILIASLVNILISILFYLILIDVIGSWLAAAGMRLPGVVYGILVAVHRIVDPLLAPIRRILPSFGGLDLSPLVLLLVLQYLVQPLLMRLLTGY